MSRPEGDAEGFTAMPFTYRRAREAGLTRAQLRRAHVCLLRNVYVDRRVRVDGYVRARAVLLVARERTWEADLGRREDFEDARWRIVVLVGADIYRTPGRTVERLRRIFASRGYPARTPE